MECPVCTYDRNPFDAKSCELCEASLTEVANLAKIDSLSSQFKKLKKRHSLEAVSVIPYAKDPFRDMKAWLLEFSESQAKNISVSLVSTARSAKTHLRDRLVKTNKPRLENRLLPGAKPETKFDNGQQNDATNLADSDPWLSDSPNSDTSISIPSSNNKVDSTNFTDLKQQIGHVSNRLASKFKSPKTLAIAKVLLMLTAMIGVSSITTILVYNQYGREESVAQQKKSLSTYSDIKLYDTMKAVSDVPEGLFSYGGALCFAALQRDGMNAAIRNAHPSFALRYVEPVSSNPGCTTGIKMLLNGELSIAQNSRPLTVEEVNVASSRGYKLESVPVAIDGIVFYTNKSLGIKSLSLEQMRDIYLGQITNWKQLGGKDLPITPISLDPKIDSILRLLMETENAPAIGNNVVITRDFTSAIRQTSSTPGAISYASSAVLKGQSSITPIALSANSTSPSVSAILADGMVNLQAFEKNVYPLTRRLYVVIRRDGSPDEKAGVAYTNLLLSREGQKIFRKAGFVPLFSDGNESQ